MGEALKDAEGVSSSEVMSGTCCLISLGILGQGSMKGEVSDVNVEEPRLEAGGGDQSSRDME